MIHFDSEADMEEAVVSAISDFESLPWNASPNRVLKVERQVRLGAYGIADIVCTVECMESGVTWIEVVELKNTKIKLDHLAQLARYKSFFKETSDAVRCTLIGTKTFPNGSDDCFLIQCSDWADVYEISIDIASGATFEIVHGWAASGAGESDVDFVNRFTDGKIEA